MTSGIILILIHDYYFLALHPKPSIMLFSLFVTKPIKKTNLWVFFIFNFRFYIKMSLF